MNFLCAANQVSKSSTQIRKCIHWATEKKLWPELWVRQPKQFWYMYPSQKIANAEFLTKWDLFLPKGKFKEDPFYGWKEERDGRDIVAIHFFSGVHVFFKNYSQKLIDLQAGSVDALFLDEELPMDLWDELATRTNATNGYIHMVFTATLGQEFWRTCMEPRPDELERFPQARKWCVSLYDSQKYVDGSLSQWTDDKISSIKARCKNQAEFLKRVMGRFVLAAGKKYPTFDATRHVKPKHPVPSSWLIFEGVDLGGGGSGHKSAICFVAVRPDFRQGRVFLGWRGDEGLTTAGDTFQKHLELKKTYKLKPIRQFYDWGNKDFGTISSRSGEPFEKAEKGHDIGEEIINTLFKNDMLAIYEDAELGKLVSELSSLLSTTQKEKAKDDFCFAAGTLVATEGGERPIEEIKLGELVWTSQGLRPVTAVAATVDQEVWEYRFQNGQSVRCTPGHRFFTPLGLQPISSLTPSDTLYTISPWQNQKASYLTGLLSAVTRTLPISLIGLIIGRIRGTLKRECKPFTKRFGRPLSGLSQPTTPFITKIMTRVTTGLKTWLASLAGSMRESICKSALPLHLRFLQRIWRKPAWPLKSGTDLLQVLSGTKSKRVSLIRPATGERKPVLFAEGVTRPWMLSRRLSFVLQNAGRQIEGRRARIWRQEAVRFVFNLFKLVGLASQQPALTCVAPVSENFGTSRGRQTVFNLTVEGVHEYFAAGLWVANCDAFRYAVTKIPWDFNFLTEVVEDDELSPLSMNAKEQEIDDRRKRFEGYGEDAETVRLEKEFEDINHLYEGT